MKPVGDRDEYRDPVLDKRIRLLATVSVLSLILPILISNFTVHTTFVIATSSMTPTLINGDLVIASLNAGEITEGTIIVFKSPFGGFEAHRVAEEQSIGDEIYFKTKGDANNQTDSFLVSREHIIGPVRYIIPKLGMLFLIPREIMLLATMGLIIFYIWLTFKPTGKLNKDKLSNHLDENQVHERKGKLLQTCCIIMILLLTNCLASDASVKLIYCNSPTTTALTVPPFAMQSGTKGTSTIYDNGVNADVSVTSPTPWLDGWSKRVKLTIDHSDVSSNLVNFPTLVHLSGASGRNGDDLSLIFQEIGSNRLKIAITESDAKTQCYVEIEKWIYPLSSTSEILRPNAVGDTTIIQSVFGAPTHWQAVDESAANEDADYVYTMSGSYQRDLYNLPSSTGSGTINSVVVYFRFKTGASFETAYARAAIKTYGTVYLGSEQSQGTTSYVTRSHTWTINPYTGTSWTWDEITSLQAGLELRDTGFNGNSRCTQVYVEVNYTPAGGEAWLWVKAPLISSAADTELYLYYDNSHADNTGYVGDIDSTPAQNVWDSNYKSVWHLIENPTGTPPQIHDSTINNRDGTTTGMIIADQVNGKIDGSLNFDGVDAYIQTTSGDSKTASAIAWEAWFKTYTTASRYHVLWEGPVGENGWGAGALLHQEMHISVDTGLVTGFYGTNENGGDVQIDYPFTDTASFHHLAFVITNPGTSPSGTLYLDGAPVGTDTGTQTSRTEWDTSLRIGRPGLSERYFNGIIDEVRVSNIARSAAWIKASYESGRDDLLDFGTGETYQPPAYDYLLKVVNQATSPWKVNLNAYSSSNIGRITTANLIFHDGSTSTQITINNGVITQPEGPKYDLAGSATIYFSIDNLETSTAGTSYLYMYLIGSVQSSGVYTVYQIVLRID